MSDPLYTDSSVQHTFPSQYMRLLHPLCGGHPLWAPRHTSRGGGALGDVGMIVDGAFYKEFNVFEYHQEQNPSPLSLPPTRVNRDQAYNMPLMSSAKGSSIEFHVTGSTEVVGLPLQTLDVQPKITLARDTDDLAFLTPPVPTRWDGIDPPLRIELRNWLSAQCLIRPELEGRVVVTEVVRSSGYVGGLILSRQTEASVNLSLGGIATASAGASVGHYRALNALLRGPDDWTADMPAEYPIILKYTTAVRRPGLLRRVGLKLGLSRSSSTPQAGGALSPTPSTVGPGSQGGPGTAPPSSSNDASQDRPHDAESLPGDLEADQLQDPSPLTPFLEMILQQHPGIGIAVGDLRVLSEFMERYSAEPVPDPYLVRLVVSVHEVDDNPDAGIASTLIAHLDVLHPADGRSPSLFLILPASASPQLISRLQCATSDASVWQASTSVTEPVLSAPLPSGTVSQYLSQPSSFNDPALEWLQRFQEFPPGYTRRSLLGKLLDYCDDGDLLHLSMLVGPRPKYDILRHLPRELALHVLAFVEDAQTLGRVACVSKAWCGLLDDEFLWKNMAHRYKYNVELLDSGSFRERFKTAVTTDSNWRHGGRLIKMNSSPDEGVVTSLAMDDEWIVLGFNHNYLHLFEAKTGIKRHTLLGHCQGVWAISLISKGGRLFDPSQHGSPLLPSSMSLPAHSNLPADAGPTGFLPDLETSAADELDALRSDPCGATRGWGQTDAIVVSGSSDQTVRVWNASTGNVIHVLSGHTATIRCLRALHGRPVVVTGSRDSMLRVWDIEKGLLLRTLVGHSDSVRCLDVYGNRVLSGSYDCTLRLWDIDTGKCLNTFSGHTQSVYTVAYDGVRIASGGLDQVARLWNPSTGQCTAMIQGHNSLVCRLQLSPRTLCVGGADGRVIVMDISRPDTPVLAHRLAPHVLSSLASLQFAEIGASAGCLARNILVSAASDGRVVLTDLRTGVELRELSEKAEQVWCVGFRGDRLVIVCLRHGRTVVELWSFAPAADA